MGGDWWSTTGRVVATARDGCGSTLLHVSQGFGALDERTGQQQRGHGVPLFSRIFMFVEHTGRCAIPYPLVIHRYKAQ